MCKRSSCAPAVVLANDCSPVNFDWGLDLVTIIQFGCTMQLHPKCPIWKQIGRVRLSSVNCIGRSEEVFPSGTKKQFSPKPHAISNMIPRPNKCSNVPRWNITQPLTEGVNVHGTSVGFPWPSQRLKGVSTGMSILVSFTWPENPQMSCFVITLYYWKNHLRNLTKNQFQSNYMAKWFSENPLYLTISPYPHIPSGKLW